MELIAGPLQILGSDFTEEALGTAQEASSAASGRLILRGRLTFALVERKFRRISVSVRCFSQRVRKFIEAKTGEISSCSRSAATSFSQVPPELCASPHCRSMEKNCNVNKLSSTTRTRERLLCILSVLDTRFPFSVVRNH